MIALNLEDLHVPWSITLAMVCGFKDLFMQNGTEKNKNSTCKNDNKIKSKWKKQNKKALKIALRVSDFLPKPFSLTHTVCVF